MMGRLLSWFNPPPIPPHRVTAVGGDDDYDDPPRIEARPCGGCLMFMLDDRELNMDKWGRCSLRKISVTARMQAVLKRNEPTCFMEAPK